MGMIRAEKLVFEYDKRDEEGNVIGSHRAIDGVDIDVLQGSFCGDSWTQRFRKVYPGEAYECDSCPDRWNDVGGRKRYERSE